MKDLTTKILAEFDEQFVKKDMGPDGDGYDANLPCWNDYFNRLRNPESEWEKEFDQIEAIKSFIAQALQRQLDEIRGRIEGMTLGGHRDEDKRIFAGGYDSAISDILAQLK